MIARARRSRSWRSGSATEIWCRTCSCFIGLLHPLILPEEPENGETGLAPHIPLQLLHLRLDHQVNRFMGCDCHIELFFRWFKCILGCRHLLSLSENGVRLQVDMALIASLLISLWVGRAPTKRTYELPCFYLSGWASPQEVLTHIQRLQLKAPTPPVKILPCD